MIFDFDDSRTNRIVPFITSVILAFISSFCVAKNNDFQIWTNSTALGSITQVHPKLKYSFEYQGRFGDYASRLSQLILRPGIGYQIIPSTSLWLGYAWIRTSQPFTIKPIDENRIWQQILWNKKFNAFTTTLRSRLEERFIQETLHTAWRYRQLFRISYAIPEHEQLTLIGSNEVFFHLNRYNLQNNIGFDQNRAFIGIGYKTSDKTSLELGCLNQYIKRPIRSAYNGNYLFMNLIFNFG